MGLKKDIEDAFIKNITPDKDNEFQVSAEARKKVEVLAEDLSKAIVDFITAQTFRVDKLSASAGPVSISPAPLLSTPVVSLGAPVSTVVPPITVVTVDVDKDGGSASPIGGGALHSNNSEVRVRKGEVTEE